MKTYKAYIKMLALTLVFIVGASGCSDFFDLERPTQNPWQTLEDFERAPTGAYGVLFGSYEWRQAYPYYAITISSMGDDIEWVNVNKWNYWRVTPRGTTSVEATEGLIYIAYRAIGAVNNALDFVNQNNGNPYPEATESELENGLNRIVGELHFIRGFSYYMLETIYGHAYVPGGANSTEDLPMIVKFASTSEEAIRPTMGSTQQIWDLILSDFQMAKELMPERFNPALHDPSYQVRANKFAASAMLMRTYFQRGEYDLAKLEADYILTTGAGDFALNEDPIEAFNKSGLAERGNETIWYLPFSDQTLTPPNHLSVLNTFWNGKTCTWSETRMASKTMKRLNWKSNPGTVNDIEFNMEAKRDKRFSQLMMIRYPTKTMLDILKANGYKSVFDLTTTAGQDQFNAEIDLLNSDLNTNYQIDSRPEISDIATLWPWKYYRGPGADFTNVPLIRLAEVYLTRSIIKFMDGDLSGAADDLNVVRERAWDTSIGGAYVPVTSSNITDQMIHDERLIELFNEGDRLNYLRGLKVDVPQGERGDGSDPYTSNIFVYPLPQSEKIYNENAN